MRPRPTGPCPSDAGGTASGAPTPAHLLSATDPRIRRVLGVMERECGSPLTVSRLAEIAGLSRSRFAHLFRAETGGRFRPTLRETRLSGAQALLGGSSLSVKEIACRVGFLSASAFSRAFRKRYGQAPSQWRRRHSEMGIARLDNT
jgi:transcriptional regulator GlxA family with amidase domain